MRRFQPKEGGTEMLHTETVNAATLELLKTIMRDVRLQDFALVGGTSLSLQIGHRVSVDLDLFTDKEFKATELRALVETFHRRGRNTTCQFGGCLRHETECHCRERNSDEGFR